MAGPKRRPNAPKLKGKATDDWGSPSKSRSKAGGLPVAVYIIAAVVMLLGAGFYFSEDDAPTDSVTAQRSMQDSSPPAEKEIPVEVVRKMEELEKEEADVTSKAQEYWRRKLLKSKKPSDPCDAPIAGFKTEQAEQKELMIVVDNRHDDTASVYWVDEQGAEVHMADLNPKQRWSSGTYAGHAWRIRDSDGGLLKEGHASDKDSKAPAKGQVAAFIMVVKACDSGASAPVEEATGEDPGFSIESKCPELKEWVSVVASKGYHPLCIDEGSSRMAAFVGGKQDSAPAAGTLETSSGKTFRQAVEKLISMPEKHTDEGRRTSREQWKPQSWEVFDKDGHLIDTSGSFNNKKLKGLVLIFIGGRFIYPGVRLGYQRSLYTHDKSVVLETMSLQPLVYSVDGFLGDRECAHIIKRSKRHMAPSKVSLMDKDQGKADKEFRTSSTYFLTSRGDKTLQNVDVRVANLTATSPDYHEDVQVLRYDGGQYYGAHHDYWPMDSYTQPDIVNMVHGGWKNRLVTVFWYMSDVQLGGETNFPSAVGFSPISHPSVADECRGGLRVRPRKGKVIVFYSLHPDGTGDKKSLHGACPVGHGQKWAANKWVWNQLYRQY